MVEAPVTKITGTFEPGHGMAQWFSRWCVHRWGRARRHKLTTAPNHDLQIEDCPEDHLAEKRQQSIATASIGTVTIEWQFKISAPASSVYSALKRNN